MKMKGNKYKTIVFLCLLIIGTLGFDALSEAQAWTHPGSDVTIEYNLGVGTETPSDKLHVVGDITLGDGTDTSRYFKFDRAGTDQTFGFSNTALWSTYPAFEFSSNVVIKDQGPNPTDDNFVGFWLEGGAAGGFVRKNAYSDPLIMHDIIWIGDDGPSVQLAWDTNGDGAWAYCEGLYDRPGTPGFLVNCANYTGLMTDNDHYWVWKNSHTAGNPGIQENRRDLKFLFDGQDNDGVMGFMEDEDYFYFDDNVVFNTRVGIGTASPSQKLHIYNSGDSYLKIQGDGSEAGIELKLGSNPSNWIWQGADNKLRFWLNNGDKMVIDTTGNVGIGDDTPTHKLDVNGDLSIGSTQSIYIEDFQLIGQQEISEIRIGDSGAWSEVVIPYSNVGIGTTTPAYKLDIAGRVRLSYASPTIILKDEAHGMSESLYAAYVAFYDSADNQVGFVGDGGGGNTITLNGEAGYDLALSAGGIRRLTIDNSTGNVGIGTTSPDELTHIFSGNASAKLKIDSGSTTPQLSSVAFSDQGTSIWEVGKNSSNKFIIFDDVNTATRLLIDSSGNVGIGIDTPAKKLDVNGSGHFSGDLTVDGNIGAKYQDLAEWVMTSEPMTPGTVVMIDTEKVDHVTPSDMEYNTLVAGVVSPAPGIILGEEGENKAIVAHTGRVKVKVDTSSRAIAVGDLLVSSPVKGHAMKSVPIAVAGTEIHRPGTIIGKALEPLAQGRKGEILALITLQ